MSPDHRCIAGPNCCRAEYHNQQRIGALTQQPDTLCGPCRKRIETATQQLPKDWTNLRDTLGERTPTIGQRINSSRTPAIPISTRKEALMAAIVDMADRAAAVVAELLHTDHPTGRRTTAPPISINGQHTPPQQGTPAQTAEQGVQPPPQQILTAAIRMIHPNIELLATAPQDAQNVWAKFGETREVIEISGIDIALQLVELHNQARAELGLTRLRHKYEMPCPNCGNPVGRDDGTTIVDCKQCQSSWTEREYKFLVGLITRERLDMEILKWLLAESYWRLDKLHETIQLIQAETSPDVLDLPGAGRVIAEAVTTAVDGHKTPTERAIVTDRKATEQRQTSDDTWTWRNETPYHPPKRESRPYQPTTTTNPIPTNSLLTVIDIDHDAVINGDARCHNCNLIHPGDCT